MAEYQTKEYHREKSREHYLKYKASYNKRNQEQKARSRILINEAQEGGCVVCGEDDSSCLDFHHKDREQKDMAVSQMLGMNDQRLQDEIAKCIVLCSNCHRKGHADVIDLCKFY